MATSMAMAWKNHRATPRLRLPQWTTGMRKHWLVLEKKPFSRQVQATPSDLMGQRHLRLTNTAEVLFLVHFGLYVHNSHHVGSGADVSSFMVHNALTQ